MGYSILVNRDDPNVRQRYTVAHEIAHFLRHRDRVQHRLRDDRMYRSGHGTTVENEASWNRISPQSSTALFAARSSICCWSGCIAGSAANQGANDRE
jgi:hypothetical protein